MFTTPKDRSFRVLAFVPAYNEEDIIVPSLQYLIKQGLSVYLIDNWSTDSTYELASKFLGEGLLAVERFPTEGPPPYFNWKEILIRFEALAKEVDADWFLLQGVDEIHASPWSELSLRDAILRVDREGFNCINHTVATFHPVDDGFMSGSDFESYFRHFEFSSHLAHFVVMNGWKNLKKPLSLAESGGHEIRFEGRRVYPYSFLLKHYPVRSQAHGEKKIFRERRPRYDPELKATGWHYQYDHIREGYSFLRSPAELPVFDEASFNRTYIGNGLPIIDWVKEHAKAMSTTEQDKAVDLLSSELASKRETIQSLAAEIAEKNQVLNAVTAELASKNNELERTKAALERSATQLAERNEKVLALVDHVAERQGAVEFLATQLTRQHERVLTLVDLVAERQRAVDSLATELGKSQHRVSVLTAEVVTKDAELEEITRTFSWRLLRLYGKLKHLYLLPFYRLLRGAARKNEL